MIVSIAADHKGYLLKDKIMKCLKDSGIEYIDNGTNSGESVDYPDYALRVGRDIREGKAQLGILICDTGIGMSIAANKLRGIRAAYVIDERTASSSKHHNNANVMALGSSIVDHEKICSIVSIFLSEQFDGERHERRVKKLEELRNM